MNGCADECLRLHPTDTALENYITFKKIYAVSFLNTVSKLFFETRFAQTSKKKLAYC